MVTLPPAKRSSDRRKIRPVAALTLVAASANVDDDLPYALLGFDRPVRVTAIRVAAIRVGAVVTGALYHGNGPATLLDERTVRVTLAPKGPYPGTDAMLFADADSGIAAADDGGTWAGTSGTVLPFP